MLDQSVKGFGILLTAVGIACGRGATPTAPSPTAPVSAGDLQSLMIGERAGRLDRNDKVNRFVPFHEPAPTLDELIKHVPGLQAHLQVGAKDSCRTDL